MMRLQCQDLEVIGAAMRELEKVSGINVEKLVVAGHTLWVEKQDNGEYILRGADRIEKPDPKPVLRANGR